MTATNPWAVPGADSAWPGGEPGPPDHDPLGAVGAPVIGYPELRRRGVPNPVALVGSMAYVLRGGFLVAAAGGAVVLAMWLTRSPAPGLERTFVALLPVWIAATLAMAWLVGTDRFARAREGVALYYASAVWVGVATAVGCLVGLGLRAPLVSGLTLLIAYDAFVLRRADSLRCSAILVGCWVAVAVGDQGPVDWDAVAFQVPMFAAAWAVGSIAHRAYGDASGAALRLATTDPLTGRLNRSGLTEMLVRTLDEAERANEPVSVLMLDLDDFKQVNDRFGHAAGDAALRWAGARLTDGLRADSAVGRLGGDEFVAILPLTGPHEAAMVAGRVSTALAERVGASVGWATAPKDGLDAATLLRIADGRLYAIKAARKAGR